MTLKEKPTLEIEDFLNAPTRPIGKIIWDESSTSLPQATEAAGENARIIASEKDLNFFVGGECYGEKRTDILAKYVDNPTLEEILTAVKSGGYVVMNAALKNLYDNEAFDFVGGSH